jgi:hypothetical protein
MQSVLQVKQEQHSPPFYSHSLDYYNKKYVHQEKFEYGRIHAHLGEDKNESQPFFVFHLIINGFLADFMLNQLNG